VRSRPTSRLHRSPELQEWRGLGGNCGAWGCIRPPASFLSTLISGSLYDATSELKMQHCLNPVISSSDSRSNYNPTPLESFSPLAHQHLHRYDSEADAALAIKPAKLSTEVVVEDAKQYRMLGLEDSSADLKTYSIQMQNTGIKGSPPTSVCNVLPGFFRYCNTWENGN
jgi:hypothetical protein